MGYGCAANDGRIAQHVAERDAEHFELFGIRGVNLDAALLSIALHIGGQIDAAVDGVLVRPVGRGVMWCWSGRYGRWSPRADAGFDFLQRCEEPVECLSLDWVTRRTPVRRDEWGDFSPEDVVEALITTGLDGIAPINCRRHIHEVTSASRMMGSCQVLIVRELVAAVTRAFGLQLNHDQMAISDERVVGPPGALTGLPRRKFELVDKFWGAGAVRTKTQLLQLEQNAQPPSDGGAALFQPGGS